MNCTECQPSLAAQNETLAKTLWSLGELMVQKTATLKEVDLHCKQLTTDEQPNDAPTEFVVC